MCERMDSKSPGKGLAMHVLQAYSASPVMLHTVWPRSERRIPLIQMKAMASHQSVEPIVQSVLVPPSIPKRNYSIWDSAVVYSNRMSATRKININFVIFQFTPCSTYLVRAHTILLLLLASRLAIVLSIHPLYTFTRLYLHQLASQAIDNRTILNMRDYWHSHSIRAGIKSIDVIQNTNIYK